jgi:hypothetical protein
MNQVSFSIRLGPQKGGKEELTLIYTMHSACQIKVLGGLEKGCSN